MRLEEREVHAWADFAEAGDLLNASVSEHAFEGRRLYDSLQAAKPHWDVVAPLLAHALMEAAGTGDSHESAQGGVA